MLTATLMIQAQSTYQISAQVLTNNYQNMVPNYPVIVIDSGNTGSSAVYNFVTDANGQFTDSLTTVAVTGTLTFLAPDSCGFTGIVLGYSTNTPSTMATAGLVLCNNIVNTGTNCSYTVNALPVAGQPNMVAFNTTANNGTTYAWDFGDGNTSSSPAPFHTYAQPGTYYYCLSVDSCPPVCGIIVVPNISGCDPTFIPQVNGSVVNIFPWLLTGQFEVVVDWGDAVVDTFTPQNIPVLPNNISHTYANPGNYQICLTHSNASIGCSNTYCDSVTVATGSPFQCNAAFVIDSVNSQPGVVIAWNTSSVAGATANTVYDFVWDFGDGTTSNNPYPTHQYQNPGSYAICLTLTASDSSLGNGAVCTSTFCDSLAVDQNGNIIYKGQVVGWSFQVLNPATVGIDEDLLEEIKIYPNPANDFINISIPNELQSASIELLSINGQLLRSQKLTQSTNNEIAIADLPPGLYLAKVNFNQTSKVFKIIKQ